MMSTVIFFLILIELFFVGWIDLKTKKISNRWVLANIGASVVAHLLLSDLYPFTWSVFFFPMGFLTGGFLLYLLGIMGAGDSKFLASLFLLIPLEFHLTFFEKLIYSTMITGSFLLLFKVFEHGQTLKAYIFSRYWKGIKQTISSRFSYAPVICVAWILMGLYLWK